MNGFELKKLRKKHKLTQDQLANHFKLARKTISLYENTEVPFDRIDEFMEYFSFLENTNVTNSYKYSQKAEIDKYSNTNIIHTKNQLFKSIPFYDINVSAGNIVFLDDGLLKDKEPDDWFDIPKSVDADIAFPTYGHSMSPVITNGDKVAYKFITDWSFFNYGMKYMIVTDEQRMVKYLRKHEKEEFILLESENPEYDPIDMPISSVRHILQVRYIGKIEM
ncbi:S24 family peptidase [Empedobacter brevis]|uniref:S24 family peptidase n=1 Tax=Empedobacter brevis TaxID=247 RepID=UPI0033422A19